jgi:hypothetical protein
MALGSRLRPRTISICRKYECSSKTLYTSSTYTSADYIHSCTHACLHTYIPLPHYSRCGNRGISNIPPREDVTGQLLFLWRLIWRSGRNTGLLRLRSGARSIIYNTSLICANVGLNTSVSIIFIYLRAITHHASLVHIDGCSRLTA